MTNNNQVFQVLDISGQGARELNALAGPGHNGQWLIQSRSEDGLNVHYQLCILYPRGREYEIKLPWEIHETCLNCQGQGTTYIWRQGRSAYEAVECPECHGRGAQSYDSELSLVVTDGLGGRQIIRKSQGGRLNARLGLRGDLILNLTWVEELPRPEDSCAPAPETGLN